MARSHPRATRAGGRRLSDLLDVIGTLEATPDLPGALRRVLAILARDVGAVDGAITLLDGTTGDLRVEMAGRPAGPPDAPARREGAIVSRVLRTGRAVVEPAVTEPPSPAPAARRRAVGLHHDAAPRERRDADVGPPGAALSYVCVPICDDDRAIGAVELMLAFDDGQSIDDEITFCGLVGTMVARAVGVHRLVVASPAPADEGITVPGPDLAFDLMRGLVGASPATSALRARVAGLARAGSHVLLRGEAGTGKALVARLIHAASPRAHLPFVRLNADPSRSQPSGNARADDERPRADSGRVEESRLLHAAGGTLYVEEAATLSIAAQQALLGAMSAAQATRVAAPLSSRVRVVAATTRDLALAVREGAFDGELYARLAANAIDLPPLRERGGDILPLAEHFLNEYAFSAGKDVRRIASAAIERLTGHAWPGNVRELRNCIERAVVACDGRTILAQHLPPPLQPDGALGGRSLKDAVADYERDLVVEALERARGNCARAALLLATTERVVAGAVRKYGLDPDRFR